MNSNPAVQHKDMIQFFTGSGSPASRDIVIRDNVIDNPEHSHAIFFTNPMANSGDRGAYYQNIVIENNDIRSAHAHGISINHGDGVTIRNNTLTQHRYCNLLSGNSACATAARPCRGMPRQGRPILIFHGVAKPTMERREWTDGRIRRSRPSWNI